MQEQVYKLESVFIAKILIKKVNNNKSLQCKALVAFVAYCIKS